MADHYSRVKDVSKEDKALMKALETPEEKRARRLAKKEAKEKKRKMIMGMEGYTNFDNPFGDANLEAPFVWAKKYEKEGKQVDERVIAKDNKKHIEETQKELEAVKKARLKREQERQERAEEIARQQREKESVHYQEYEKQEESFHLKQARLRSKIRVKEGRGKPIDFLAQYYEAFTEPAEDDPPKTEEEIVDQIRYLETNITEPYNQLNGLRKIELEDLIEDIQVYKQLCKNRDLTFWNDLLTISHDELAKLKNYSGYGSSEGINPAVVPSINNMFVGKSPEQLLKLKSKVEEKLSKNEPGLDITYWETVLSKLKAFIAKARLQELHKLNMQTKPQKLKELKELKGQKVTEGLEVEKEEEEDPIAGPSEPISMPEFSLVEQCKQMYKDGRYSPTLLDESSLSSSVQVTDLETDRKNILHLRNKLFASKLSYAEEKFVSEARKGMGDDEAQFSVEEKIIQDKSLASWADKYKPRKPRYFNRVHTGFEWNKYNQTHYDIDNPPPKIVQGYKFNLFYPDLIDKSQTPKYTITPCPDNREFAIIRFSAGPPYEDIAFKIVNREWNFSYRTGFRSQFNNGILQLWFHFKRYRYRR